MKKIIFLALSFCLFISSCTDDTMDNQSTSGSVILPKYPIKEIVIKTENWDRFASLMSKNIPATKAGYLVKDSMWPGGGEMCIRDRFISIPAGLARMRLPAFILFTTLGSAIWNSILVLLGYYLAQILPEDRLLEELERYSREISYVFAALVTLALITWYLKRKLKACR